MKLFACFERHYGDFVLICVTDNLEQAKEFATIHSDKDEDLIWNQGANEIWADGGYAGGYVIEEITLNTLIKKD